MTRDSKKKLTSGHEIIWMRKTERKKELICDHDMKINEKKQTKRNINKKLLTCGHKIIESK